MITSWRLRYAVRTLPFVAAVAICSSQPPTVITPVGVVVIDAVVAVVVAVVAVVGDVFVNDVVFAICSSLFALCGNGSNLHIATHICFH